MAMRQWGTMAATTMAALVGFAAVGFGAFGAHVIHDAQARAWIATGATYGLAHAVAALWAARQKPAVALLWACGALLFSASLYALALGGPRASAAAAPVGGTLLLLGWLGLLATAGRRG
jgi:uncharacterized membrane protein YgdD (TMEM256/DUF423 family)